MSTTQSISSVAHVCVQLQRTYAVVRRAMNELGVKPALSINGQDHYADADVERVREYLNREHKPANSR